MTEQDRADIPASECKYRAKNYQTGKIIMLQSAEYIKYHPDYVLERRNADGNWESATEQPPTQNQ